MFLHPVSIFSGIRSFKRQMTKEERLKNSFAFEEDVLLEDEDQKDVAGLQDDLESTKQLLELEVRSKKLLERDNKKLQVELEKLRAEFHKLAKAPGGASGDGSGAGPGEDGEENADDVQLSEQARARRNSMASKRQSMIRLISESESSGNLPAMLQHCATTDEVPSTIREDEDDEAEESEAKMNGEAEESGSRKQSAYPPEPINYVVPNTETELIESMKEEVEEARKLAEDWEARYKEMQRQMAVLDVARGGGGMSGASAGAGAAVGGLEDIMARRPSIAGGADIGLQRMASVTGAAEEPEPFPEKTDEEDEESWMQKREIHQLKGRLRNIQDKREVVFRERKLLSERIESITASIAQELDSRKKLRKEVKDMNEAFKEEILDMEAEERTAQELEECYFSDEEDLVVNKDSRRRRSNDGDDEDESFDEETEEEDVDETLEDILKLAEDEDDEEDPGHLLFDKYPESDEEESEGELQQDKEKRIEKLNKKVDKHGENLQLMRKSNFMLKSKIDRLFDILQMQREKHRDIKQELARMLADIQ